MVSIHITCMNHIYVGTISITYYNKQYEINTDNIRYYNRYISLIIYGTRIKYHRRNLHNNKALGIINYLHT